MRAARWLVVGTALVAAAAAFYLLTSPDRSARPVVIPKGPASDGPPQEEIDAESRDAMRDFLRESVREDAQRARPDER